MSPALTTEHPDDTTLRRFLRGELDRADSRRVVEHLASDCRSCRDTAGELWRTMGRPADPAEIETAEGKLALAPYEAAIERAFATARRRAEDLQELRRRAPELASRLDGHPVARQLTMVRNSAQYASFALSELLQERSYDLRFDAVHEAVDLAEVAVAIAEQVPEGQIGRRPRFDLLARAQAHLGNARRIVADFGGARSALDAAAETLRSGTGDPLLRALVLRFRGNLERECRRFPECHALLGQAARIYKRLGESRLVALCVLAQGMTHFDEQQPREALSCLQQALSIYQRLDEDPRVLLVTRHNIAVCLNDLGRTDEARELVEMLRPEYHELGDRINLLRLRWLDGLIAQRSQRPLAAELALLEARDGLAEQQLPYDTAQISLDLVGLWAEQGRWQEMRQAAEQSLVLCRSLGATREAIAALVAVRQAIEAEQLSAELLRQVSTTLRHARHRRAPST